MKGIIFTPESVRAILDGKKTQTRRLRNGMAPRYAEGETVYVKEPWRPVMYGWQSCVEYGGASWPKEQPCDEKRIANRDDFEKMKGLKKLALRIPGAKKELHSEAWRSALMMPEWASRLRLCIVSVRPEIVNAITEEDARAEGVEPIRYHMPGQGPDDEERGRDYRTAFKMAWQHMHGPGAWDVMVWRIDFRVVPL